MPDSQSKPTQSPALLIGIVLTLLAVVAHRFLPERRLAIDPANETSTFFPVESFTDAHAEFTWIDQRSFHYACKFPDEPVRQGCGFIFMLADPADAGKGTDLSRFKSLNMTVSYTGKAQYFRVAIRNFDPRFSNHQDANSPKFNYVNLPTRDLNQRIVLNMSEFAVAEWWAASYNHPRMYSRPDVRNATVLNFDLQGDLTGTEHEIHLENVEFVGDWISAEYWYLGILCLWMFVGTTYGVTQWVRLRRAHRAQRQKIAELAQEKEKYQKLSTMDALTNVLNRHGIDQFVAALGITGVTASVIVIDLDHFKRVNDQRGHHVGDRVLRTMGEILRTSARNTDAVGRWGGEEFVMVCPGASLSKAAELAEKLRRKIMETNFIPEEPLAITASFGVATSGEGQGFEDVFRQADQALYLAKNRGRNCVVAAADEQMHTVTGASKGTLALVSGRFRLHR